MIIGFYTQVVQEFHNEEQQKYLPLGQYIDPLSPTLPAAILDFAEEKNMDRFRGKKNR